MSEPIEDVSYWTERLQDACKARQLWKSVYLCGSDKWQAIERKHREILARHTRPSDGVLDAGCGYGRLLDLLPDDWNGYYRGIDFVPAFIRLARELHPSRAFTLHDLREPLSIKLYEQRYDWAVLISVRPMVIRNLGQEVWDTMEENLRAVCDRLLYLEYDETDEGEVS